MHCRPVDVFVVTYRVTNFLPKLFTCYYFLQKKLNFHFWFSAIFGLCQNGQHADPICQQNIVTKCTEDYSLVSTSICTNLELRYALRNDLQLIRNLKHQIQTAANRSQFLYTCPFTWIWPKLAPQTKKQPFNSHVFSSWRCNLILCQCNRL